ncbi:MAG: radical SAM family heme chaperone HemW [Candidatus Cryptobacteroides sp.]
MIYIHIPFCRSFCTYCDFYSEIVPKCAAGGADDVRTAYSGKFAQALFSEIRSRENEVSGDVDTLYIGGGTPSVLPLPFYASLMDVLSETGHKGFGDEFTMEVNPDDIVEKGPDYVRGLMELGVNRFSMGVQSLDDGILKWMNRRHDAATARRAYSILEDSGADNISIDLIFGLPQLSDEQWRRTVSEALEISSSGRVPAHMSAYQLSVEPGSALARMVGDGRFKEAGEEHCRRQYDILCHMLADAGYHHYEISNFACPGKEAVHNSAYWSHIPYSGFGPGAHSFIADRDGGNPVRRWNNPDLNAYLKAAEQGDFASVSGQEILSAEQMALEEIMLSLRTDRGIAKDYLYSHADGEAVERLLSSGRLAELPGGSVRIPEDCFFISDSIIAEIV